MDWCTTARTASAYFCRTLVCVLLPLSLWASGKDLDSAQNLLLTGKYQACIDACRKVAPDGSEGEDWDVLHASALLAVGQYAEAELVISNGLARVEKSVRLRVQGMETANRSGNPALARTRLKQVSELAATRMWAYRDPANIVALGRAALRMGADPKTILERLFSAAEAADPHLADAWVASGELALDKHDFTLAAKTFSEAQQKFPDDARVLFGLARAYEPSDRAKMLELLQTALEKNENHVPSLLLLADHLIDSEEYVEADKLLERALKVNPWQSQAWAYRAVLAHLRGEWANAATARDNALKFWATNPEVDHLIGLKLSQKYRFGEGSPFQRRALGFDPDFEPARVQLAEDLLRLGEEKEGWALAEEAHQRDGYNVTAYNLTTLRRAMGKFATITNESFVVRMATNEAVLYGDRALALLERAKAKLVRKYGVTLESPTYVEIFPDQKDFAVRTFGMPDNPGFLGVCFGRVLTANSPASAEGNPENWEAVLWHEFCHVVTLQLTRNRMPRWLSEGISVYEERQENSTWGQSMTPRYREMVLGEDLTPVSKLSAAFLSPKSDVHIQFAYYESELVVEYLIGTYGFDRLKAVLIDLGNGEDINEAIPKHTKPLSQIEEDFGKFARARAEALGPALDWRKPKADGAAETVGRAAASVSVAAAFGTNAAVYSSSSNYWVLTERARNLVSEKKWAEVKAPLQTLIDGYPEQCGPNCAYALLAAADRALNDTNAERAVLEKWASLDDKAADAYLRLMELGEYAKDWKDIAANAQRYLGVNPLVPQPYRFLARASQELGDAESAINSYAKLLWLDPADPAEVHFRLANLLRGKDPSAAKRHVLQALEDAPRFREAHRLLLEIEASGVNQAVPQGKS